MRFLLTPLILLTTPAFAFDMSSFFGGGEVTNLISLEHQRTSPIEEQRGVVRVPFHRKDASTLSFIGNSQRTELREGLRFTDRNVTIPHKFYATNAGLAWSKSANEKRYGVFGTYGRAGTGFWSNAGGGIVNVTGSMERPAKDGNSWLFFLSYSNNRTTLNNVPLPGFAYSIKGESYRLILGVPFVGFFYYRGIYSLRAGVSPFSASTELAARVWGPMQVYGNLAWQPRAYQNLVPDSEDRLIFEGKEAGAGVRVSIARRTQVSLGYVRGFDRRFKLGKSRRKITATPVSVGDEDGYAGKISISF